MSFVQVRSAILSIGPFFNAFVVVAILSGLVGLDYLMVSNLYFAFIVVSNGILMFHAAVSAVNQGIDGPDLVIATIFNLTIAGLTFLFVAGGLSLFGHLAGIDVVALTDAGAGNRVITVYRQLLLDLFGGDSAILHQNLWMETILNLVLFLLFWLFWMPKVRNALGQGDDDDGDDVRNV